MPMLIDACMSSPSAITSPNNLITHSKKSQPFRIFSIQTQLTIEALIHGLDPPNLSSHEITYGNNFLLLFNLVEKQQSRIKKLFKFLENKHSNKVCVQTSNDQVI